MDEFAIEITVREVAARKKSGETVRLLDVREDWEFEHAHLEGAEHIPLPQIPMQLDALLQAPESEIICYCHTGRRSLTAAQWLRRSGIPRARSMAGGIEQWSLEVDPSVPRY